MPRRTVTEPARATDVLVVGAGAGRLAAALSPHSNRDLDRVEIARVHAELERHGVRHL